MAFGSPRASGANEKERSAEIHAAGRFLYVREEIGIDVIDLLVKPQAVEIAQLRENGNRLLACSRRCTSISRSPIWNGW